MACWNSVATMLEPTDAHPTGMQSPEKRPRRQRCNAEVGGLMEAAAIATAASEGAWASRQAELRSHGKWKLDTAMNSSTESSPSSNSIVTRHGTQQAFGSG
mmetsp:Transcript_1130/g.2874  ORF Transcript_1130/g.2874 Transcript_1130/m.2874 type:complete len:101 (-) Transcript_1130:430-732(-)